MPGPTSQQPSLSGPTASGSTSDGRARIVQVENCEDRSINAHCSCGPRCPPKQQRIAFRVMGKLLGVVFIVFVVVAFFAMAGDLFPEGSFLNEMARGIRNVAGDMFGGGYGAVSPG